MYAVTIVLRAQPGQADALVRECLAVLAPSRAEPGCLFFDVLRSASDPDEVVFYEAYRTKADFDAHLTAPHVKGWQAAALPLIDRASIRMPAHVSIAEAPGS
jgi:quinol monooxygenase YgiN